jgi:ribosomal protein L7/L12
MTLLVVLGVLLLVGLAFWVSQLGQGDTRRGAARLPATPLTDSPSEANVRALLAAGDKIAAIKHYRALTGLGLKESKDAVDALEAGQSRPIVPTSPSSGSGAAAAADPEVLRLVQAGQLIEAIKRYRELTGAGLKEAKDAVEGLGR